MNTVRNFFSRITDSLLRRIELTPPSDKLLLRILFFTIIFSGAAVAFNINKDYSVETPVPGGVLKEGIVGTPRFVNPVLANTRADQDISALVYSGLLRIDPQGELVPDIAESITTSEDGLTYNIILRKDVAFHDGVPLTANDVIFTIQLIQNADLKSPLRGNWTDVTVEKIGDYEINVLLKDAYAPFTENFLVGIVPAHLFEALPIDQLPFSQLNTEPVGSGPFKVISAKRDVSGVIESYTLQVFKDSSNPANIETVETRFYSDEATLIAAFEQNLVHASAYISNKNLEGVLKNKKLKLIQEPLPRVFGIFFNQNRSAALRDDSVREALTKAIVRDEIIDKALSGHGVPITEPITSFDYSLESEERSDERSLEEAKEEASAILENGGWRSNNIGLLEKQVDGSAETLSISLKTSNVQLFTDVAEVVRTQWEAIGVEVETEQYEQTGLVQSVIRPRDFQALLFGLDMNRSQDLYPFWHSSQKDDPGLNVAQYTNLSVDAILESARGEQDAAVRLEKLREAGVIIAEEQPGIFLFQPVATYIVNEDFVLPEMNRIGRASDRFSNMNEWYTASDQLWRIFRK